MVSQLKARFLVTANTGFRLAKLAFIIPFFLVPLFGVVLTPFFSCQRSVRQFNYSELLDFCG